MHVDMDAFYASVELAVRRPDLRGRPVIVGGYPRGVVLSATYEARAFGVKSGMSSSQAACWCTHRRVPEARTSMPTARCRPAIGAVFRSVTSVVEAASIDEVYLDFTGARRMFGAPAEIGGIRPGGGGRRTADLVLGRHRPDQVRGQGRLPSRPSRTAWSRCGRTRWRTFLHPLPVEAMWGVWRQDGRATAQPGHHPIGDLAHTPRGGRVAPSALMPAAMLRDLAWGRDGRSVVVNGAGAEHRLAGDVRC